MAIRSAEAIPIGYPEANDGGRTRYVCLVRLTTDEGVAGWGEAVTLFEEATRAAQVLITGLGELVVGEDPLEGEAIWNALHAHTWWYGNGGIASMAIAALDIAIWDLKGKLLGKRLLDLLGGPVKSELPATVACHATKASIDELAAEAAEWLESGAHGIKVGFGKRGEAKLGYEQQRDVAYVGALRRAIGPDKQIMIDVGAALHWSVDEAIARVRAFEEHGLHWIEEPLGNWNPAGYTALRDATSTLIAYGEREYGLEGVERVLETKTCDVLGIDPGRAEGITTVLASLARVESAGGQANAHAFSTAIVTAASLALSWSSAACKQLETKPLRDVAQYDLVAEAVVPIRGAWPEPTGVGLGIDVVSEVVDHYRLDR
jgi:L-alanine-DL-glutamate epimerase-like enolase superfamily enzyme